MPRRRTAWAKLPGCSREGRSGPQSRGSARRLAEAAAAAGLRRGERTVCGFSHGSQGHRPVARAILHTLSASLIGCSGAAAARRAAVATATATAIAIAMARQEGVVAAVLHASQAHGRGWHPLRSTARTQAASAGGHRRHGGGANRGPAHNPGWIPGWIQRRAPPMPQLPHGNPTQKTAPASLADPGRSGKPIARRSHPLRPRGSRRSPTGAVEGSS